MEDFKDPATAFVGARIQILSDLIIDQGAAMLESHGLKTNPRSVSIMTTLHRDGPMSLTELARKLGQPHQVVAQRLAYIEQTHLVRRKPVPADARRRTLHLTPSGQREAALLLTVLEDAAQAFETLFEEIGNNLLAGTNAAIAALESRSLTARIREAGGTEAPPDRQKVKA